MTWTETTDVEVLSDSCSFTHCLQWRLNMHAVCMQPNQVISWFHIVTAVQFHLWDFYYWFLYSVYCLWCTNHWQWLYYYTVHEDRNCTFYTPAVQHRVSLFNYGYSFFEDRMFSLGCLINEFWFCLASASVKCIKYGQKNKKTKNKNMTAVYAKQPYHDFHFFFPYKYSSQASKLTYYTNKR